MNVLKSLYWSNNSKNDTHPLHLSHSHSSFSLHSLTHTTRTPTGRPVTFHCLPAAGENTLPLPMHARCCGEELLLPWPPGVTARITPSPASPPPPPHAAAAMATPFSADGGGGKQSTRSSAAATARAFLYPRRSAAGGGNRRRPEWLESRDLLLCAIPARRCRPWPFRARRGWIGVLPLHGHPVKKDCHRAPVARRASCCRIRPCLGNRERHRVRPRVPPTRR